MPLNSLAIHSTHSSSSSSNEERVDDEAAHDEEPPQQPNDTRRFLRWAIIGAGSISGNFVRALGIANRNHQVCAVASSSLERAARFRREHCLPESVRLYGDCQEALRDPAVEVVYIGVKNSLHKEVALAALDNGKHVLCERPLAMRAHEVEQVIAKAQERKRFLMEGYWSRFFPAWATLRADLPKLGEVHLVHANLCLNAQGDSETAKADQRLHQPHSGEHLPPQLPSGCYYTLMFALWVYGGEAPESVHAVGKMDENGDIIWGSVTLTFARSRVAILFFSQLFDSASPAVVVGSCGKFVLPDHFWCCTELDEVAGELWQDKKVSVQRFPIPKDSGGFTYPRGNAFYMEADHVYDCIEAGKLESDVMPFADSMTMAAIVDEVRRQIAAGGAK